MAEAEIIPRGNYETPWGIVERHLSLANRLARSFRRYRVPIEDLEAEGRLGLFEAALRYDPSLHVKFATYASSWVLKRIRDAAAAHVRLVRVPRSRIESRHRALAAERELRASLGRTPSTLEIAAAAGVPVTELDSLRAEGRRDVSLDEPVAGAETVSFGETLPETQTPLPDRAVLDDERLKRLAALLESMPERERAILILRYGLDGEPPRALADIAVAFGISRQRVHNIERDALARLRKVWVIGLRVP